MKIEYLEDLNKNIKKLNKLLTISDFNQIENFDSLIIINNSIKIINDVTINLIHTISTFDDLGLN